MMPTPPQPTSAHQAYLRATTLRQKVGQMLMVGFAGKHPHDSGVIDLRRRAEAGEVSGVIFFSYNIEGPEQVRALVQHIRGWQTPLPLLISIDQEGGAVQRLGLKAGFHGWPKPADVAALPQAQAEAAMDGLAAELQHLGFNFNYAPCVDLFDGASPIIGALGRSYGADPTAVCLWAGLQMAAHSRHGVRSAIKHFPGHGSAQGDTHRGLTDITPHWHRDELRAFGALIATYPVDAVMTSHLVHRGLDPLGVPATFSKAIVQHLLRGELGYDGVVISDDLGMGALVHDYDFETIVERTVTAGHDLLLFGQNAAAAGRGETGHAPIDNLLDRAAGAVQSALDASRFTASQLEASLARIVAFKFQTP